MVNVFKEIKDEIISFDRYCQQQIIAIDRQNNRPLSWTVNDRYSYGEWLQHLNTCSSVKVEGLESNPHLLNFFKDIKNIKDIHLFHNPRTSYSFNWHYDFENVFLYVVKGYKIVRIKNKIHHLSAGQGIKIPKGHLHKVLSKKNTWALSVGSK